MSEINNESKEISTGSPKRFYIIFSIAILVALITTYGVFVAERVQVNQEFKQKSGRLLEELSSQMENNPGMMYYDDSANDFNTQTEDLFKERSAKLSNIKFKGKIFLGTLLMVSIVGVLLSFVCRNNRVRH
ncbi:MAG: hypothetical protein ABII88_02720 [Candidatus Omnitrophota bacterium]